MCHKKTHPSSNKDSTEQVPGAITVLQPILPPNVIFPMRQPSIFSIFTQAKTAKTRNQMPQVKKQDTNVKPQMFFNHSW
jgi:hypothetical protein